MSPMIWLALAFGLGIGLASVVQPGKPLEGLFLASLFMFAAVITFLRGKRKTPLFLLFCFCALGYTWFVLSMRPFPVSLTPFLEHYVEINGTLSELPVTYPNRIVYTLDNPSVKLGDDSWQGSKRIQAVYYRQPLKTGENYRVYPGMPLKVNGRLTRAPLPANPGEFNYRSYLERRSIIAVITTEEAPVVQQMAQMHPGYLIPRFFGSIRLRIEQNLDRHLVPEQAVFLKGFLLGTTGDFTPEEKDIYRRTGVMHLFAVSGLHLGFVLLFFLFLARLLRFGSVPTFLLVAFGLWGYAALIAFPASVTRAAVMGTVGFGAYLWKERANTLNSLALAALVILICDPRALMDPGFQLSFAATWGIISLAGPLGAFLTCLQDSPFREACRDVFTISLAAQLAVLPLCALYFQQIPVFGLLANILVVPVAGLVINLGLAGMVLALFHQGLCAPFFLSAGALSLPIKGLLGLLAGLPGSALDVSPPSWRLIAAWFGLLGLLGWSLHNRGQVTFPHFRFRLPGHRWFLPSMGGLVCLAIIIYLGRGGLTGSSTGVLRVTFINVGQGDSVLVELPNGSSLLVDGGGKPGYSRSTFEPGRQVVVPYLIRSGIRKLDLVVNSHPHEDHLGGLPAVLEKMPVGGIVVSPVSHPTPLWLRFEKTAREKEIPLYTVSTGKSLRLDPKVRIDVISPPRQLFTGTRSDLNNNSLALHLKYGEVSFLLTGDIEKDALDYIAAREQDQDSHQDFRTNLLKAPHHGSATGLSPAFADLVRPQVVVISTGPNSFGHPDPKVIKFWQERSARVLRTDEDGAIILETDGRKLFLRSAQSPKQIPTERAA